MCFFPCIKYHTLHLSTILTAPRAAGFQVFRFLPQANVWFLYFTSIPLLYSQGHSDPHGLRTASCIPHGRCLWFIISSNTFIQLLNSASDRSKPLQSNSLLSCSHASTVCWLLTSETNLAADPFAYEGPIFQDAL